MHNGAKNRAWGERGEPRGLCTQCCTLTQTTVPKLLALSPHLEYKVGGRRSGETTETLSPTQKQQFD